MRRRHLTMHAGTRRGQALLVAVLLMMAILLVGILFVALVTYNQEQSMRHEDSLAAQAMAEAGIRYATHMLENAPEGADWRPPEPPALYVGGTPDPTVYGPDTIPGTEDDYYTDMELARGWAPRIDTANGRYENRGFTRYPDPRHPSGATTALTGSVDGGYFFLRVSYLPWTRFDADDPDPMDWHIRIESIGRVEGTQVYRRLVAYKPIPTLNYARWVHDVTREGRPAFLGIPAWADMDLSGDLSATPIGASAVTPPEWLSTSFNGPIRVNGRLRVAGSPYDTGTQVFGSTQFNLLSRMDPAEFSAGEYPRNDTIEVSGGIDILNNVDNAAEVSLATDAGPVGTIPLYASDDPNFETLNGRIHDGEQQTVLETDLNNPAETEAYSRFASRIEAPKLTLGEGETAFDRYRALTRDSGDLVLDGTEYVNNGRWGYGKGIYIDNFTDIQFDHDIQALIDDWQRPTGNAGTPMADSGWNALFTTYTPPAVEIEFLPQELPVGDYVSDLSALGPNQLWWPNHEAGQPGIKITRYDRTWRAPDGSDSGQRTIVMDYPTPWLTGTDDTVRHPLIVAEGNVRVSGRLPAGIDTTDLRLYNLAVVSGGTIYIDGQILSPNDYLTTPLDPDDEVLNTKVALLARDCVCLNATRIVPQDTIGTAFAGPDDPLNPADPNKHWELSPGGDGRGYSLFYWGEPSVADEVRLVAKHAAADPGPSGVGLTSWVEGDGYTAYDFVDDDPASPTLAPPMLDTTFALVPEATIFPNGAEPPQTYGVAAVAPNWAPYTESGAGLPWRLGDSPFDLSDAEDYLLPEPGIKNAVLLQHADPHLGAGSTSYWLKKWKIAEYDIDGNPIGAINARVNASVFVERGCWYVLGPGYFDEELTVESVGTENPALTPEEARARVIENRRYNYRITFVGTIAENFTASVEAAQGWTDRLAYPGEWVETGADVWELGQWGTIEYIFDESLRSARFPASVSTPTNPAANLPRLPLLPVSPDLVYYGE